MLNLRLATPSGSRLVVLMAVVLAAITLPASAVAGSGYELDTAKPSIALDAETPHGIAVDQVSQNIYVAEVTTDLFGMGPGQIEQLNASGSPTAASPFVTGGPDLFAGVAVNPGTQGIYAYQVRLVTPFGSYGAPQINNFSSTGTVGPAFGTSETSSAQIAADSTGRIYFPNDVTGSVQVFNATGALQGTIVCTACPGGGFSKPASVALDSASNLYVVDLAGGGRVIKFKPSGGSYVYDSLLQSGQGAAAVGVDPSSNDVFVGDLEGGYHVVAYDSSGNQFDSFGAELLGSPPFGANSAGQIAANATTHKVYLTDPSADQVWVFKRVASIPAPAAVTKPATSLGQLEGTLNALVSPHGHGLTDCHFEYTNDTDFQLNSFINAISVPCSSRPGGTEDTTVSTLVSGLTPATTYDFRIVVASNGGSDQGSAQSFTTLPPLAPSSTTGAASALTQTTATLGGSVNPNGGPISNCHFEYTNDTDFQQNSFTNAISVSCLSKPSGATAKPVSAKISGLTAATGYQFRVVATNNSGTTQASPQGFATSAETCATNPAVCPPPTETPPTPPSSTPPPPPTLPPTTSPPAKKPLKCRKGFRKKNVHGKAKCVKTKKRHRKQG